MKKSLFFIINTFNTCKRRTTIGLKSFEMEEFFLAYSIQETFSKETLRQAK